MKNMIVHGDNLTYLNEKLEAKSIDMIYIDPPFNTKKNRKLTTLSTKQDPLGDRTGFQDKRYKTEKKGTIAFSDIFDNYLEFLKPRLEKGYDCLLDNGSFFLHLDYREVHYAKILVDRIFGRDNFMNEIIWAYDFGGRSKKRWPAKHDNILWYVKDRKNYTFNYEAMDRIPYMAPGLVGKEKAARGKTPTDCFWHTIVPTNGRERTGYPTQKPFGLLERLIKVHTNPGDVILDYFAGSGTTGDVAGSLGRTFIMVDNNDEAIAIMNKRLGKYNPVSLYLSSFS